MGVGTLEGGFSVVGDRLHEAPERVDTLGVVAETTDPVFYVFDVDEGEVGSAVLGTFIRVCCNGWVLELLSVVSKPINV